MMKRILRSVIGTFARLVGLAAALALLLSAALLVYATTDDFRARLLARAVPELDRRMAGELSVGGLSGSPWTRLRLEDAALAWHGEEILRLPAASVELDWAALFDGRLVVAALELESPQVVFREHPELGWDWREALAPLVPAPDDPRPPRTEPLPVVLERVAITGGVLRVAADGRPVLEQDGIDLVGRIDFERKQVELLEGAITRGGSRLRPTGRIPFHGRWQIEVDVDALHPRDLAHLSPALAESLSFLAPATGHFVVTGETKRDDTQDDAKAKLALDATGGLAWPEARLDFAVHGEPDPLAGRDGRITARLEATELARFFPDSPVAGRLVADVALTGGEGTLAARLDAPGAGAGTAASGAGAARSTRSTRSARGPAGPNRSARSGGLLEADGRFTTGEPRTAALRFRATRLDPAAIVRGHPEWKGELTGTGTLDLEDGRGPARTARLALALEPSQIGRLAIRSGRLDAALLGESIELGALALESASGRVHVKGRLSTDPTAPISLDGRLELRALAPFLALAGREGRGALRGSVAVAGTREQASLETDLTLRDYEGEGLRIDRARLVLQARGRTGERDGGGKRDGGGVGVDARIAKLRLETDLATWQLAGPARLQASADAIEWTGARFESDGSSIDLDGRLARRGPQTLRVVARALPVAAWARAFPERIPSGLLTRSELDLDLAIGGTAPAPTVDLRLAPRDLVVSERAIEQIAATLRYDPGVLAATLEASTAPALHVEARARLPFELRWDTGFTAKPTGPLEAHADCDARDLAFLEPLLGDQVDQLGGEARCRIDLAGPLDALEPSGEVTVHALRGRLRRAGVTVVDGELALELAADRFRVRRASASAEGFETARFRAEGEGPLPTFLTRWTRPGSDRDPKGATPSPAAPPDAAPGRALAASDYTTTIELERWPLLATSRDRLITSGRLTARGRFEAPRIEGRIEIVEGTLRPNLAFLSGGPPPRDPTIQLEAEAVDEDEDQDAASTDARTGTTDGAGTGSGPSLLEIADALELAVDIDVGRDLWIKHESAEVLLAGRVAARKQAGKPLSLEGRIEAQRGFADLQRRRFRLIEGSLELVGGAKIDPVLDVLGRHKARAHVIDARLTGTASKPVLTLSSDPTLSQEDILAVLLFGRPSSELSQEQQSSLSERAVGLASSMGLTAVGRSVASAIGLDALGLQIDELSSQRASVGAYVGRNIFVALAQEFSGERGQELSIEYEFWPGWSLVGSTTSQGTNSADLVWKIRY